MSKSFLIISLAIKQSLRFENETQYSYYHMNNSIKNLNLPKNKSQCISLDWFTYGGLNVTKSHVAGIIPHEKQTNMQNN